MAQIVECRPSAEGFVIQQPGLGTITGMTISMLVGSGTLRIDWSITVLSSYAGSNALEVGVLMDGAPLSGAKGFAHLLQNVRGTYARSLLVRPGAGTHTFALQASASQTNIAIHMGEARLIVHELGY